MALDATPKALTSNSYATVAQADTYFTTADPTEETTWNALSTADKERYLQWATRVLDDSYNWIGLRTETGDGLNDGQALEWPRRFAPRDGWGALSRLQPPYLLQPSYVYYSSLSTYDFSGVTLLDEDVIPQFLYEATAQMALALSVTNRTADTALSEVESVKLAVMEVKFRDWQPLSSGTIPSSVHDMVRQYGRLKPSLNTSEGRIGARTIQVVRA